MGSTLLDIAKANGVEQVINEASRVHPEMLAIPSFPLKGITVKGVVYTGASNTTGSFRKTNAGTLDITETSEERTFECFTAEPRIEEDRAVADRYELGSQAWMEAKSGRVLDLEMLAWCKQMYYGSGNNSDGFPGLIQTHDATNMAVDATGTTASTGSSVWLLRVARGQEDDGVRWRFGNGGGCCSLGLFGGSPSYGVCRGCNVRTGELVRPPPSGSEEVRRRLTICGQCDQSQRIHEALGGVQCRACGCGLRRVTEGCPEGRFG